jgi:hypothetical protein
VRVHRRGTFPLIRSEIASVTRCGAVLSGLGRPPRHLPALPDQLPGAVEHAALEQAAGGTIDGGVCGARFAAISGRLDAGVDGDHAEA